jgi:pSer/pThr/pTyr-binding forkhead associated (FHA) protein
MARNYHLHNPQDPSGPHTRSSLPQVTLEIIRGRARQRIRPIVRPAFLIGSAADSDLMLGSQQFPTAHCYLLLNPEGVGLRWLGFAPEVLVNDRPVEKAELQDGDLLRTGPYEFRIRIRRGDSMLRLSHPTDADAEHPANDSPHGNLSGPQDSADCEADCLLNDIRRAFGFGHHTPPAFSFASAKATQAIERSFVESQRGAIGQTLRHG